VTGTRRYRALAGAGGGVLLWLACQIGLARLPAAVAFYPAAFAFIYGWGALALIPFEDSTPTPERTALALALGTAFAPLLIWMLEIGRVGFLFPPCAFAATGAALARSVRPGARVARGPHRLWYVFLPVMIFAVTAWVSAGRLTISGDAISVFGDYDTFDLTYYAVITAELTHTEPPASPFYAGHQVVYSYFPLLLLAAIYKFTGVSLTQICLGLAWPFFSSVASAIVFAWCRRLGSSVFAALSTILIFGGSSLAYVPGLFWPESARFDSLIWSSMFLAPSAEWLFFNTWTPALTVVFAGLYALTRLTEPKGSGWTVVAGVCFGLLFMFKSFAFGLMLPAVAVSALVYALRRDRLAGRLVIAAAIAVLCAAPWLWSIVALNGTEGRANVSVDWLSLPRRMLFKMDLRDRLATIASSIVANDPNAWVLLTMATVLFLVGGLGVRCLGIAPLWRAATGHESMRRWTPLAWIVILGVSIPFAIAVAPFPNTIQAYQFALFAMWPFAARVVWPPHAITSPWRWLATVAVVFGSVVATAHYGLAAHAASGGQPIVALTGDDLRIVRYLRRLDSTTTMVLHSIPLYPSLYSIESARRVVLAWSSYAAGDGSPDVDARVAEIERFFGTTTGAGADDVEILSRYQVTHVIERVAIDHLHPHVVQQLHLVTGTPDTRLYEVKTDLAR
jgi:hypothetical protein